MLIYSYLISPQILGYFIVFKDSYFISCKVNVRSKRIIKTFKKPKALNNIKKRGYIMSPIVDYFRNDFKSLFLDEYKVDVISFWLIVMGIILMLLIALFT